MKNATPILLILFLTDILFGQDRQVSVKSSVEFPMFSKSVDDTFHIQISLPESYQNDSLNYPVLYLLDSDKSFGMVSDITRWLKFDCLIPDLIIVGIAYKDQWWQKRSRDYTPSKDNAKNWGEWPLAGGADLFLDFIENGLNSTLTKFRINWQSKFIIGHSFGGILATYALWNRPHLFDNYICISPALIWDYKYLFDSPDYKLRTKTVRTRVYTAIGELDEDKIRVPWLEYNEHVAQKKLSNLDWYSMDYKYQSHSSVLTIAISDGLRKLLE